MWAAPNSPSGGRVARLLTFCQSLSVYLRSTLLQAILLSQRRLPALIDIELELVPLDDCSEGSELLLRSLDK